MINSKHSKSKIVIIILLISVIVLFSIIITNFYFMFNSVQGSHRENLNNVSSNNNFSDNILPRFNLTHVEFSLRSVICGNEGDKHVRTFFRKVSSNGVLTGIKFIAKDKNGRDYNYLIDNSSLFPISPIRDRRIDISYSQLGINPSEDIISLGAVSIINNSEGKPIFGDVFLSPEVCYSSCNDCSVSCELICNNSTG